MNYNNSMKNTTAEFPTKMFAIHTLMAMLALSHCEIWTSCLYVPFKQICILSSLEYISHSSRLNIWITHSVKTDWHNNLINNRKSHQNGVVFSNANSYWIYTKRLLPTNHKPVRSSACLCGAHTHIYIYICECDISVLLAPFAWSNISIFRSVI